MNDAESLALIKTALTKIEPKRAADFVDLTMRSEIDALGLDSLAIMETIGYLEDHLETTFSDDEMAKVETVGDLATMARTGKVDPV